MVVLYLELVAAHTPEVFVDHQRSKCIGIESNPIGTAGLSECVHSPVDKFNERGELFRRCMLSLPFLFHAANQVEEGKIFQAELFCCFGKLYFAAIGLW